MKIKRREIGMYDSSFIALYVMLILVLSTSIWILKSNMEATSYNRLTGSDVTTWEAMWIELRVNDAPKGDE